MKPEVQNIRRAAVSVSGIVQGVGFRPFLHRTARACGVTGWVRNTSLGVELELEGPQSALDDFVRALHGEAPPLAVVEHIEVTPLAGLAGYRGFEIRDSRDGAPDTLVSPDVGTCPDCLRELRDPQDRRFRYPFINCTNCGPRFTITKTVPYDRRNTTMAPFVMCGACAAEYADIENRRYHAQPDCCPACGPQLWFADSTGRRTDGEPFAAAQALLKAGGILAVKGLGGFHLACLPETAAELRRRKRRSEKPFALMCPDVAAAQRLCVVSEAEKALLESFRRPIVLLQKRAGVELEQISQTREIGIMLPYTPVHYLLFDTVPAAGAVRPVLAAAQENTLSFDCAARTLTDALSTASAAAAVPLNEERPVFEALVMTSANLSDCPVIADNDEAVRALAGIADGFLLHDRAIDARCDDSLVRCVGTGLYFFRRSRGYAPQPLPCAFDADGILALGAEQKASFALGKAHAVFCSQHIGDLKNAETLLHYEQQIERFERLFGIAPRRLVCDLHPDYLSSAYAHARALRENLPLLEVQHHWAHMAACMADNGLAGECIGLIWDGTGLGSDGAIWGAEALIGGYTGFRRAASLRPVLLAGGDSAIREIARIGTALALDAGIPEASPLPAGERAPLEKLLTSGLGCTRSSGMGRLFDGVYSILSGMRTVSYEGQGAILLEAAADEHENGSLPITLETGSDGLPRLDPRALVRTLWEQRAAGTELPVLAARFLNTLAEAALLQCRAARAQSGLARVVLSGGVWLDGWLLRRVPERLEKDGFTVFYHHRVSTCDEGISLGQAAIAAHRRIE